MSVLDILRMGHPVLIRAAEPVENPAHPDVSRLIDDMIDTMVASGGVGLAAPQVGVSHRVVVFRVPAEPGRRSEAPVRTLINPHVEVLDATVATGYERCLSLPGLTGAVPRFLCVRYRGLDRDGRLVDEVVTGYQARIVQHECDHLDGVVYPMRMNDLNRFGFVEEVGRALEAGG